MSAFKSTNFAVAKRLSDGSLQIVDLNFFRYEVLTDSGTPSMVCRCSDPDTGLGEMVVLWNGDRDQPGVTHELVQGTVAAEIMTAFFSASVDADWDLDESVVAIQGRFRFTVYSFDPLHIAAWVEEVETTSFVSVHAKKQEVHA